ncbi:biotin/lipoyl-containing protein [Nguyenibacter sp. L1]|uniref:acetyl-CoA carboxylase biotin carboxyl carrier protein n=1 Tax=Nguyenibacter sp. L1 TaxID=3049350 RepID=UPI002B45A023|nr:biotin/lipoyl-containing protein [Nguyenibacter sp. L1]WRH87017.1 biotin/lipoyl-containing protein [Nguyenibacter sp. L1]
MVPDRETLPDIAEIGRIAEWLAAAGLTFLELSSGPGSRLRISVDPNPVPAAPATSPALPSGAAGSILAKAPFFGRLCLRHPSRDDPFAPVGATVRQGDVVALLTIDTLQIPVTAPVDGVVTDVLEQPDTLVGYGADILAIRPV